MTDAERLVGDALMLLDSMQSEINCGIENGVVPRGFCQGTIYIEGAKELETRFDILKRDTQAWEQMVERSRGLLTETRCHS